VHRGVRGFTVDLNGRPIPNVNLRIKGRNVYFKSTNKGEFWRVLLPGVYTIIAEHPNYQPSEKTFVISNNGTAGALTYVNVEMYEINHSSDNLPDHLSYPSMAAGSEWNPLLANTDDTDLNHVLFPRPFGGQPLSFF